MDWLKDLKNLTPDEEQHTRLFAQLLGFSDAKTINHVLVRICTRKAREVRRWLELVVITHGANVFWSPSKHLSDSSLGICIEQSPDHDFLERLLDTLRRRQTTTTTTLTATGPMVKDETKRENWLPHIVASQKRHDFRALCQLLQCADYCCGYRLTKLPSENNNNLNNICVLLTGSRNDPQWYLRGLYLAYRDRYSDPLIYREILEAAKVCAEPGLCFPVGSVLHQLTTQPFCERTSSLFPQQAKKQFWQLNHCLARVGLPLVLSDPISEFMIDRKDYTTT